MPPRTATLGPKRDVVGEREDGRRRYLSLECGHEILAIHRYPDRRWAFCQECAREPA